MCTGRVDLSFILRAFIKGADGVIIGGCWPGECHYVTEGNYDAMSNVLLGRKLMQHVGLDTARLRLEWISASEGSRFAEVMSDFSGQVRRLGALGTSEGIDPADLELRLESVGRLIPYMKLVEREKLRVPTRTEEGVNAFFASEEVDRLLDELVAEKLAVSQILLLLHRGPLSTGEIAGALGLQASDVSRYMNASSRQGLVRYDVEEKRYALARA